jgi:hypothetical protein
MFALKCPYSFGADYFANYTAMDAIKLIGLDPTVQEAIAAIIKSPPDESSEFWHHVDEIGLDRSQNFKDFLRHADATNPDGSQKPKDFVEFYNYLLYVFFEEITRDILQPAALQYINSSEAREDVRGRHMYGDIVAAARSYEYVCRRFAMPIGSAERAKMEDIRMEELQKKQASNRKD